MPDGKKNRFVLNNKIEIKIRYKKRHSKPCGQTWPVIRFRLSALLHGQNKLKAPNLFHALYRIFIKKHWITLNNFKKKIHLLNPAVHRVPLHSDECVGQLYRLFSRGCLCFCGLLLKVVDDSHSDSMLCTFWSGNTKLNNVKWYKPGLKIAKHDLKMRIQNGLPEETLHAFLLQR